MLSGKKGVRHTKRKPQGKYKQYDITFGGRKLKVQGYEPQALKYLTGELGVPASDIKCEVEGVPIIRYKYSGKNRDYFPDIYIISKRCIVEVKSHETLGLQSNKKRGWSMTCAKAIECHKRGFKFMLLLLDKHGNRYRMPKNWATMQKAECLAAIEEINGPRREHPGFFTQL